MSQYETIQRGGRTYRVRVRQIGQHFACAGEVRDMSYHQLYEGPDRPYGFDSAAYLDALGWIDQMPRSQA